MHGFLLSFISRHSYIYSPYICSTERLGNYRWCIHSELRHCFHPFFFFLSFSFFAFTFPFSLLCDVIVHILCGEQRPIFYVSLKPAFHFMVAIVVTFSRCPVKHPISLRQTTVIKSIIIIKHMTISHYTFEIALSLVLMADDFHFVQLHTERNRVNTCECISVLYHKISPN